MIDMPTLDQIKQMISQVNPKEEKSLIKMKEFPELESFLHADEVILKIASAFLSVDSGKNGVLVATNTRCFFLYKGGLFSKVTIEQFAYDKISSVEYKTGILSADLIIHASGNRIKLEHLGNDVVRDICDFLNSHSRKPLSNTTPVSVNTDDVVSQLERLAILKENGVLTEEEFNVAKKKLLGL